MSVDPARGSLPGPVLWFGGKGHMTAKLLRVVPPGGRPYLEPYAGAAALLFARPPAPVEVLNDIHDDLVGLYRVLHDPEMFRELAHRLTWTPYSRSEFERALEILSSDETDPVMRAWAFFVAQNQSFSGHARSGSDWGRSFSRVVTARWIRRKDLLDRWHRRLRHVQIDQRDAIEAIRYWDTSEAVIYVDPPYHPETFGVEKAHFDVMDHDHHVALVAALLECRGAVVLSCYDHPVYEPLVAAGWIRRQFRTSAFSAVRTRQGALRGTGAVTALQVRTETVYISPAANQGQVSLFEG